MIVFLGGIVDLNEFLLDETLGQAQIKCMLGLLINRRLLGNGLQLGVDAIIVNYPDRLEHLVKVDHSRTVTWSMQPVLLIHGNALQNPKLYISSYS